jgi:D-inositol-3-phosphate glycosyltransferase
MRIGMLCHNYVPHPGGLEVMVQNLVHGLARRHEVTLVTSAYDGAVGTSVEQGVVVHRIPALHATERVGIPYPVPTGSGLRAALEALQSVDVLHAHGALYVTTVHADRIARRRGVPLVITEHVGFVEYGSRIVNGVESLAWSMIGDGVMQRSNAIVTYNSRVQRWLEDRYANKDIRFIGNGVDTTSFRPRAHAERTALRQSFQLPDDKPLILFAARASEKKNLDDVLQITRDDFHLVVCGAARGLNAPNLTDLGVVPYARMPELFGCVDAMVHASTGEGFPLAVQEALAAGVPLALLWDPGYAGSLDRDVVAGCDTIAELGPTVVSLATDEVLRARLSRAGRAWTESKWSWDATVAAYEQLYLDVTNTKRMKAWAS